MARTTKIRLRICVSPDLHSTWTRRARRERPSEASRVRTPSYFTSVANTLPTAMAGPYANLCACGADRIGLPASDEAINFPVCAIVAARRPRRFATTIASTPPATAVNRNAVTTVAGPTTAPTAAISFTSPAPVAPSRWPGIISPSPTANPANEAHNGTPLIPVAASATPTPASAAVSSFGIRRVRMSITVATTSAATRAAKAVLEIAGDSNGLPENRVDRVAHDRHRANRHHREQRREKPVLQQVLALFGAACLCDFVEHRDGNLRLHGDCPPGS